MKKLLFMLATATTGCSALGFPAITVVSTTSQAATNSGDDQGSNTQTPTNDVTPDVDVSIVP